VSDTNWTYIIPFFQSIDEKGSMLPNALELTTITTMIAIGSIAGALIAGTSK
jgi:hypothetical protein